MKNRLKVFFILLTACVLFSCKQNEDICDSGISIQLPGAASRAVDPNEVLNYVLTVSSLSDSTEVKSKAKSGEIISVLISNGTYTVDLKGYDKDDKDYENPYLYGSKEGVVVNAGEVTNVELKLKRSLYKVTFNKNPVTDSMTEEDLKKNTFKVLEVPYCDTVAKPENVPELATKTFDYWADSSDKEFDFSTLVKEDIVLTAKWKGRVCSVTFDENGGTGTQEIVSAALNKDVTLPECTLTAPEGTQFVGWSLAADVTNVYYAAGDSITLTDDITLYAVWVKVCTLTFNVNKGTGTQTAISSLKNTEVVLPECTLTAPEGYEFYGWATTADELDDYLIPGDKLILSDDVIYYAVWEKLPVNQSINLNLLNYQLTGSYSETDENQLTISLVDSAKKPVSADALASIQWSFNGKTLSKEDGKTSITINVSENMYIQSANTVIAVVSASDEVKSYSYTFTCNLEAEEPEEPEEDPEQNNPVQPSEPGEPSETEPGNSTGSNDSSSTGSTEPSGTGQSNESSGQTSENSTDPNSTGSNESSGTGQSTESSGSSSGDTGSTGPSGTDETSEPNMG